MLSSEVRCVNLWRMIFFCNCCNQLQKMESTFYFLHKMNSIRSQQFKKNTNFFIHFFHFSEENVSLYFLLFLPLLFFLLRLLLVEMTYVQYCLQRGQCDNQTSNPLFEASVACPTATVSIQRDAPDWIAKAISEKKWEKFERITDSMLNEINVPCQTK